LDNDDNDIYIYEICCNYKKYKDGTIQNNNLIKIDINKYYIFIKIKDETLFKATQIKFKKMRKWLFPQNYLPNINGFDESGLFKKIKKSDLEKMKQDKSFNPFAEKPNHELG